MISMTYDLVKISMTALMRPAFDAGVALARLDERIARSAVGAGFLERSQFTDACASLWIDGELVHLEDLVLHDATKDKAAQASYRPPSAILHVHTHGGRGRP